MSAIRPEEPLLPVMHPVFQGVEAHQVSKTDELARNILPIQDKERLRQIRKANIHYEALPEIPKKHAIRIVRSASEGRFLIQKNSKTKALTVFLKKGEAVIQNAFYPAGLGKYHFDSVEKTLEEIVVALGPEKRIHYVPIRFDSLTREKAEELLASKPTNRFVLRASTTRPDIVVVSMKTENTVSHLEIKDNGDGTYLLQDQIQTEEELIEVFGQENLITPRDALELRIQKAFQKCRAGLSATRQIFRGVNLGATPLAKSYFGEAIDTKHRYGQQIEPFFDAWKEFEPKLSFNEWLEKLEKGDEVAGKRVIKQYLIRNKLVGLMQVKYCNRAERKAFRMIVNKEGKVVDKEGNPFTSKNISSDIFVVSPSWHLYHGEYKQGTFNHSSFLAGGAVQAAGGIVIKEGKVVQITDRSGHYQPDEKMMLKAIKALLEKGVDLQDTILLLNYNVDASDVFDQKNALDYYHENKGRLDDKPNA